MTFQTCAGGVGEHNIRAKLTKTHVLVIRSLYKEGITQRQLADRFGVYPCTINSIINRKTWKHVADGL